MPKPLHDSPKELITVRLPESLLTRLDALTTHPERIPKTHRKLNNLTTPSRSDIIRVALGLGLNRLDQPIPF